MARLRTPKLSVIALSVGIAMAAVSGAAFAQETANETLEVEPVIVKAKKKAPLPAQAVYDEQQIDMQPSLNGTITDLFVGKSQIGFDSNSRNGTTAGEITPSQISIRGGRPWDNNFMIDEMSNNNVMNPTGYETTGPGAQPASDAQSLIIDTDLLQSVEMFSENIGAEYGDFTGGVVNAKLRDARMDRWHGKITGRFTSDSVTSMFWVEDPTEFRTPDSGEQREFTKYSTGITLDGPLIEDKLGMVLSYQRTDSTVPAYSIDVAGNHKRDTTRLNENFLLKLHTMEDNDFYVSGTLMYAPYENSLYHSGVMNSDYDVTGGGLFANLHTRANLSFGRWTNDLSYAFNESNRDGNGSYVWYWAHAPGGYASWPRYSKTIDSVEGSYGDMINEQESYSYKSVLDFDPIQYGRSTHKIKLGGELSHKRIDGSFDGLTMFQWTANAIKNPNVQGDKYDGVISGEQAFNTKTVLSPYENSESYTTAAFFVEDNITIDRVTLRPGARVSYDTITKDINVAPRLFADLDILGDNRYHVNAGYNRYYGSQLLTYITKVPWRQWRWHDNYKRDVNADGSLGPWVKVNPNPYDKWTLNPDDLVTPYTDEFTLGASADINDTIVSLQAVKRNYRDQLVNRTASQKDPYNVRVTNEGESDYWGLTLALERAFDLGRFGQHQVALGITHSKLTGANSNFTGNTGSYVSNGGAYDPFVVEVNGELKGIDDIDAGNFNPDWTITYSHMASFLDNRLRAMILARYESSAERLYYNGISTMGNYLSYYTKKERATFNVDMKLSYDFWRYGDVFFTADIEALNVFNRKNMAVDSSGYTVRSGDYALGRQFFFTLTAQY